MHSINKSFDKNSLPTEVKRESKTKDPNVKNRSMLKSLTVKKSTAGPSTISNIPKRSNNRTSSSSDSRSHSSSNENSHQLNLRSLFLNDKKFRGAEQAGIRQEMDDLFAATSESNPEENDPPVKPQTEYEWATESLKELVTPRLADDEFPGGSPPSTYSNAGTSNLNLDTESGSDSSVDFATRLEATLKPFLTPPITPSAPSTPRSRQSAEMSESSSRSTAISDRSSVSSRSESGSFFSDSESSSDTKIYSKVLPATRVHPAASLPNFATPKKSVDTAKD
ncbi:MAG: hypothetical protein EOO24_03165 [Comamonadaceae bacterium]|nr:MAG: hypothetical protein EOO24_03165 [Comamonadaceae bacterium]